MPSTEKYLSQSTAIAARVLGDETIIMSTVDSTIFMLNPTGTVIWQAADGRTPLSKIVADHICVEFDVTADEAAADAEAFVAEMAAHGILIVSDRPVSA